MNKNISTRRENKSELIQMYVAKCEGQDMFVCNI